MKSDATAFQYPTSKQVKVHTVESGQAPLAGGTRSSFRLPTYSPEDVARWVALNDEDIGDRGTVEECEGVGPPSPIPWPNGARLAREQAIDDAGKYLTDMSLKQKTLSGPARKKLDAAISVLVQALERWEAEPEQQLGEAVPLLVNEQLPQRPAKLLMSWRDILHALEMKNRRIERDRVRKANIETEGPIKLPRRGGQPIVDRDKLLTWWNVLEKRYEESEQKQVDTRATLQDQHGYGRDGTVLPGIAGHAKKRRGKSGDR
jgi:hypothetical protein